MLQHPPAKSGIPTTCLKPMPAMVRNATAKPHIPQPKLINGPAQVLYPQPMVFCGTPMVIDARPKETGEVDVLVYLINGRYCKGKQLSYDDRNIGKNVLFSAAAGVSHQQQISHYPLLFCTLLTGEIMAAIATIVGRKDATTAGGKTNDGDNEEDYVIL
ncbi:hypothetical protein ACTJIJ_22355 [Niabella sp. 22666]|uniref:hypothetical protein n=1 Tax=Niabella sp. 22666 TaxID=3453954 RepID=UPI003F8659B8